MIKSGKEIGFYTDVFGNEITEYEMIERYTVWYYGILFEGDNVGYNEFNTDHIEQTFALYNAYGDIIHIKDNEYDVTYEYGEWH